ncbi:MAG: fatty acid desaturase [Bradyrhizobiaceae bacterium]|nr:fatty acid desaturase [Bradyrhizobiaceae bacterium]
MTEVVLHDPTTPPEPRAGIESALVSLLNDKRDLPVLKMQLFTFIVMMCSVVMVFVHFTWWTALIHIVLFIALMGPHTITLHLMSHRRYFKQKYAWLEYPLLHALGIAFGHTPRSYFSHHIGMHHVEGGLEPDASCTHRFQRDSVVDFSKYLGRFLVFGILDLRRYLKSKKMDKLQRQLVTGDRIWLLVVAVLAIVNWKATLVVCVFTMLYTRSIMMAGNWGQHSMVDAEAPDNVYRNTITCVNAFYNSYCYNDGYHISHHMQPTMHWTEHPKSFLKNQATYAREGAIVLSGIDFFGVWFFLMCKRYKKLASHYVSLDGVERTEGQIIELLKQRTRPIPLAKAS